MFSISSKMQLKNRIFLILSIILGKYCSLASPPDSRLHEQSHRHPNHSPFAKMFFLGLVHIQYPVIDYILESLRPPEGVSHPSLLPAQSDESPSRYIERATAYHRAIQSYPGV